MKEGERLRKREKEEERVRKREKEEESGRKRAKKGEREGKRRKERGREREEKEGLNDAPQRWWKKFDAVMTSIGFTRSTFDVCVYVHRNAGESLGGILCVHVDDTICGGSGPSFSTALATLRRRFPFRKWQLNCDGFLLTL